MCFPDLDILYPILTMISTVEEMLVAVSHISFSCHVSALHVLLFVPTVSGVVDRLTGLINWPYTHKSQ